MSYKYIEIWTTVFECAKKYGVKAFTGWGICDALNWLRNMGCLNTTMVTDQGEIKEFAKDFLESFLGKSGYEDCMQDDNMKTSSEQMATRTVKSAVLDKGENSIEENNLGE